jgi:hypothetical protein
MAKTMKPIIDRRMEDKFCDIFNHVYIGTVVIFKGSPAVSQNTVVDKRNLTCGS